VIFGDGIGDILEQEGFTGFGLCHNQAA
jgi:hypothetical protein